MNPIEELFNNVESLERGIQAQETLRDITLQYVISARAAGQNRDQLTQVHQEFLNRLQQLGSQFPELQLPPQPE